MTSSCLPEHVPGLIGFGWRQNETTEWIYSTQWANSPFTSIPVLDHGITQHRLGTRRRCSWGDLEMSAGMGLDRYSGEWSLHVAFTLPLNPLPYRWTPP